jgi:hypothetical protein
MRLSPFISVPWLRHAAVTVMSRVSQSPWRLLQQLGLLRFGAAPAPERQGALLRQLGSVLAGDVGGGRWVATGNPRASFRGTQDSCPLLAEYGRTPRPVCDGQLARCRRQPVLVDLRPPHR